MTDQLKELQETIRAQDAELMLKWRHHAGLDEDDLDRRGLGPLGDDDIDFDVDAD